MIPTIHLARQFAERDGISVLTYIPTSNHMYLSIREESKMWWGLSGLSGQGNGGRLHSSKEMRDDHVAGEEKTMRKESEKLTGSGVIGL